VTHGPYSSSHTSWHNQTGTEHLAGADVPSYVADRRLRLPSTEAGEVGVEAELPDHKSVARRRTHQQQPDPARAKRGPRLGNTSGDHRQVRSHTVYNEFP